MDRTKISEWAKSFVADLEVEGERIPFERVVAAHLPTLEELHKEILLTWVSVAAILRRAGALREDGQAYNSDQLRATIARVKQTPKEETSRSPVVQSKIAEAPPSRVRRSRPPPVERAFQKRSQPRSSVDGKAVSEDEMAKALGLINRKSIKS
jgi:hypothetical protein